MRTNGIAAILLLMFAGSASAVPGGFGFGAGAAMPQGQSNRYADDSFSIMAYGLVGIPGASALDLRLGFRNIFLEWKEHEVKLHGWDLTEEYSTDLLKFTLGAEFAPIHGRFRPYGGIGLGIYHYSKDVTLKNWLDEEVDSRTIRSETDFGWNLSGGITLYFTETIAAVVNVEYDNIIGMESLKAKGLPDDAYLGTTSLDSEYISFFVGMRIRVH